MVQVMYLEKCNKLNVKGRVWGILVDTFKNANDVCECIIVPSTSFNINKKNVDQVLSVVICNLAKEDL